MSSRIIVSSASQAISSTSYYLVGLVSSHRIRVYRIVSTAWAVWEYIITVDQELTLVWRSQAKRLPLVSALLVSLRWCLLAQAVVIVLPTAQSVSSLQYPPKLYSLCQNRRKNSQPCSKLIVDSMQMVQDGRCPRQYHGFCWVHPSSRYYSFRPVTAQTYRHLAFSVLGSASIGSLG